MLALSFSGFDLTRTSVSFEGSVSLLGRYNVHGQPLLGIDLEDCEVELRPHERGCALG